MEPTKLCKDCALFAPDGRHIEAGVCKIQVGVSVVTGEPIYRTAASRRIEGQPCGPDARQFVQKPEKPF